MPLLNNVLLAGLSLLPKPFTARFASRYVAGDSQDDAMKVVERLNDRGFSATVDILGEHSRSTAEITATMEAYVQLYEAIDRQELRSNISLKLTHLGLGYDDRIARDTLREILQKAREKDNFLRIDMENSPYTDATLQIYLESLDRYRGVGTVLQSRLRRSLRDLMDLLGKEANLRICKGIYPESPEVAFQNRDEIRHSFIQLVKTGLSGDAYIAIATHDRYLIDTLETWISNKEIARNRYEFQVLYGVPMEGRLRTLIEKGHLVRIYVPFGKDWYPYAMRRLAENPKMGGYVLKNLFLKE